ARMDADDVSYPTRFEKQLALMRGADRPALCGCLVRATGADLGEGGARYHTWIDSLVDHAAIDREIFVECPIAHPTFFVRRDAFLDVGGYEDHGWAEDYDLVLRLWRAGARFAKVPEILLDWRNAPARLSLTDPRYSLERFRALKQHYLEQTVLREPGTRPFVQWGAGEVGKRWLREWRAVRPVSVVDIHPRKVGTRIHGYRVIAPADLPPPSGVYLLIAVGAPGARDEIRAWLATRGFREIDDYRFIA
ncbi:MAG: glycosyl transferase, partial [Candidatus Hydrogenedentes bacterium]|nr:glycosyl transferase [Candidatus Hydrogenedentota bacterium]